MKSPLNGSASLFVAAAFFAVALLVVVSPDVFNGQIASLLVGP
jgi:hypothetical protein